MFTKSYATLITQTSPATKDRRISDAWVADPIFKTLVGRFKQSSKYRGENATINIREQQYSDISL